MTGLINIILMLLDLLLLQVILLNALLVLLIILNQMIIIVTFTLDKIKHNTNTETLIHNAKGTTSLTTQHYLIVQLYQLL